MATAKSNKAENICLDEKKKNSSVKFEFGYIETLNCFSKGFQMLNAVVNAAVK